VLVFGHRDERPNLLEAEGKPGHGNILARLMEAITNS
jgi:hypothetical protein